MASLKLTPLRKQQLGQPQAVYQISCEGKHCDCSQLGEHCRRGFFSLWLQAVYGLYFAEIHGLPAYVNFGDRPYLYSDPKKFLGNSNFWEYYYPQNRSKTAQVEVASRYVEDYPLRIWQRRHWNQLHEKIVSTLNLRPEVEQYVQTLCSRFKGATLGIHVRLTDHPDEIEAVRMDQYHRILEQEQHRFRYFFVATDDQRVISNLIDRWGEERILYQEAIRSQSRQAVHTNLQYRDRYHLGLEVLADCYALSKCQHCLLVHSNISYAALLLNPDLSFTLLETSNSRWQRWKTSLLYYLDQWGIRKM